VLLRGTWFARGLPGSDPPLTTGALSLNPYWSVVGAWPAEPAAAPPPPGPFEAVAGEALAAGLHLRPGDRLPIQVAGRPAVLLIAGIVRSGGLEDEAILMPIETAWRLSGSEGHLSRILVRALTTPESVVYDRLGATPKDLPAKDFERWTCTPFPSSIAYELERSLPGSEARVIRRVAETEGVVLRRISGLMTAIALLAIFGAALAVTSALTTSVLERRSEIGLLKAIGAGNPRVVGLFLSEAALIGVVGGLIGAVAGALMARFISTSVFGAPVVIRPLAIPVSIAVALLITLAGFVVPARRILRLRPFEVLRGL